MVRYNQTPSGGGVGLNEYNLHQASGLRNGCLNAVISSAFGGVVAASETGGFVGTVATRIGDVGSTVMGTFPTLGLRSALTSWNGVLPVPMTPSLLLYVIPGPAGAIPATWRVRIRMTGLDQFGNAIEEITPWISKSVTTTSQWAIINMSKVFAIVNDAWVQTDNVWDNHPTFNSAAAIGWHTMVDPTKAQALALTVTAYSALWTLGNAGAVVTNLDFLGTAANWGIGTPLQVSPYGTDMPVPSPEIVGATVTLLRQKTTPTVLNTIARALAYRSPVAGQVATTSGTATGTSATTMTDSGASWTVNAYAGATITINSRTGVVASNTSTVMTLTAAGWSGTTPSTGSYTVEARVLAGVRLGQNVAGWQGTPHKIGFFSNDSWVSNKVSGVDLTGLSTRTLETGTSTATAATTMTDSGKSWTTNAYAGWVVSTGSGASARSATVVSNTGTVLTFSAWSGTTPGTGTYTISPGEGMIGEDEMMFTSLLRTSHGTRRQSGPERSYPNG
jgi:hypothetical protein